MAQIQFEDGSLAGDVCEDQIRSLERMLRLDLPDFEFDPAYLAHIREFNGGRPVERYYPFDGQFGGPIDHFLNFADPRAVSDQLAALNVNVVWSAIEDRLSIHQFPFAATGSGDYLCFDYTESGRPRICFWHHELSEEDDPHLEFVADDFTSFVDSLRSEPC